MLPWQVLNVTGFLDEHPGGEEVLLEYAGKDVTRAFDDVGHSKAAQNLVSKFQVGQLQGYNVNDHSIDEQASKPKQMEAYVIKDGIKPKSSILLEFIVPLLASGLYLGYQWWNKNAQVGS